ncbi:SusC/RagA family TonB-linked outer membrane protein [Adhaeribacter arboris]|uniref:SusC/RagA family TonB-linked outer membrane protein n=1 Tax=Adhaeribacter arboris TaxID=2072846 RepID=A0A2T2YL46_9BACT|nr:TonB-dependent receptor [Adhaeribacter arboris]PSR56234.1 SusC/RagA family TonB-linked outer membrane protein [Adhaeribacter arboris]
MKQDLYTQLIQVIGRGLLGLLFLFVTTYLSHGAVRSNMDHSNSIFRTIGKSNSNLEIASAAVEETITGKVISTTGEPLPGVTVLLKGTNTGTTTTSDGSFSLTIPESRGALVFSFVGYAEKEVTLNGQKTVNVTLTEDTKALNEVVVVGYSAKNQTQLSSSVSVVSAEKLRGVTAPNLGNLLQGKAPGVMVSGTTGQPGAAPVVRIRGTGSISAGSDPLYVVDGVIGGTANPNDIESVTVLKDAAATGLYGSRAANGVIVITTKSGKSGKTAINFNTSVGANWVTTGNLKLMNSQQLYDFERPMFINDYNGKRNNLIAELSKTNPNPSEADINAYLTSKNLATSVDAHLNTVLPASLTNTNTDWLDLIYRTGITQNYELSASGGNERTKFYLGGNYYKEQGTLTVTDYKRFNVRMNLTHQINNKLSVTGRINTRMDYTTNDTPQQEPSVNQAITNLPWDNPFNANGLPKKGIEPEWMGRERTNYFFYKQYNYSKGRGNNLQGDLVLNYDINDWLSLSTSNRAEISNTRAEIYQDPLTPAASARKGLLANNFVYTQSLLNSNLLKANKTFGAHSLSGILGAEFQTNYGDNTNSTGGSLPSGLAVLDISAVPVGITGAKYRSAFNSYFSQVDYNFDNKYFAVASFRRDGSSKFGANNLYGNFYSVGGSWIISNEDFLPKYEALSLLKVRASYGTTGNANITDFISQDLYSFTALFSGTSGPVQYAGNSGAIPARLANPDLTWEKAYTTNVGLDIGLFKRVNLSIDAYRRINSNLLFDVPLSAAAGFSTQIQNIGKIQNKGIDIDLNTINFNGQNFKWETNFNVGFNNNEVLSLYRDQPIDNGLRRVIVGQPLRTWFMQKWMGVDQQTGAPLWEMLTYDADGKVAKRETTTNYNLATRQIVGKANPDFTGGFTNTLSYKGLSLNVFLNFVSGSQVYHTSREGRDSDGAYPTGNMMQLADGWSRWEKPGDVATHPLPMLNGGGTNSNKPSSRYLEDGSFIRLRNVRLNYEIPTGIVKRIGVGGLNVFVSADNLYTWTKFSGLNPENNFDDGANITYPMSKKVLFGINVGL